MPDSPPTGFTFPSTSDYASQLVRTMQDLKPLTKSDLAPPVQAHIATVVTTIEATTGLSIGQLSSLVASGQALGSAKSVAEVSAAIGALVSGSLDLVSSGLKAAGVAAETASAIPVLGGFVDAVAGVLVDIVAAQVAYQKAQQECDVRFQDLMSIQCHAAVERARPVSTQVGGSPSDLFRPFAYQWQFMQKGLGPASFPAGLDRALPLNPASIYVVLCGDVLPAPFHKGSIASNVPFGWTESGIPKATRQRMWSCIRAICAAVEPPGIKWSPAPVGDAGRVAMIVLQEIVRNAKLKDQLTEAHVNNANAIVTNAYYLGGDCQDLTEQAAPGYAGATAYGYSSCYEFVNLANPFWDQIQAFQNLLFEKFYENGKWRIAPKLISSQQQKGGTGSTGIGPAPKMKVIMGPKLSSSFSGTVEQIKMNSAKKTATSTAKKSTVSPVVVVGGGTALFWLIRKIFLKV